MTALTSPLSARSNSTRRQAKPSAWRANVRWWVSRKHSTRSDIRAPLCAMCTPFKHWRVRCVSTGGNCNSRIHQCRNNISMNYNVWITLSRTAFPRQIYSGYAFYLIIKSTVKQWSVHQRMRHHERDSNEWPANYKKPHNVAHISQNSIKDFAEA